MSEADLQNSIFGLDVEHLDRVPVHGSVLDPHEMPNRGSYHSFWVSKLLFPARFLAAFEGR
jgi:hypothetical protein